MKILNLFFLLSVLSVSDNAFAKLLIEPSVGFGVSSLNMSDGRGTTFTPTNTNYYFLSLGINKLSFQAKLPQKDSPEVRQQKVDTKIQDYQFSLDVYKNWKAAAYYQNYKGYFVENGQMNYSQANYDLSFNHVGAQIFYMFNEKHSSFIIQDAFWNETEDSSSWIVSGGIDQFFLEGDVMPAALKAKQTQILKNLAINAFSVRGSYSRNWVWSHWFVGVAAGLGLNMNLVNAEYIPPIGDAKTNETKTSLNSMLAMSYGYKWNTSKVGLFARMYNWKIGIDDIELSSNTSSSGFYYSSTF